MTRDGFVYVFNSKGYFDEVQRSYSSLRDKMPEAEVAFVTHPELIIPSRTDVIWVPFEKKYDGPIVKTEAYNAPFDRCVFLDGDTRVVGDCFEIFSILDRFDLALAHEPTRGWDYASQAPRPFCELNTGVLAFRKTEAVREFFKTWQLVYEKMRAELFLVNDQPAFRDALWSSREIRHATLPTEYHLVTGKPNGIAWDAHILHGRDRLEEIEMQLALKNGPRCYNPDYGVLSSISGRRDAWRALFDLFVRIAPKLIRTPRDASAPSPGDWQNRPPLTTR